MSRHVTPPSGEYPPPSLVLHLNPPPPKKKGVQNPKGVFAPEPPPLCQRWCKILMGSKISIDTNPKTNVCVYKKPGFLYIPTQKQTFVYT